MRHTDQDESCDAQVRLYTAWLRDLEAIGYEFPELVANDVHSDAGCEGSIDS